jgi:hypothetical protein
MSNLGGSPLGLIGVKSRPTADGMSTFNGGRSRNVNVNLYNSGKEANKERLSKAKLSTKGGAFSLFTSDNLIKPWGNISQKGNDEKLNIGQDPYNGLSRRTLHNNDVYDTSIINLVDKTANTAAQLRPADFAYLKDLGVFPNNRLMIARRFSGPAAHDIFGLKSKPSAVLISWKPPGDEDFLTLNFGEEWIDASADFTEVLNKLGKDLTSADGLGSKAAGLLGAVPLPGWTEGLQQSILEKLEITKPGSSATLQVGNPNIIKEAKRRKTLGYGEAGSGLICKVSIKMVCEYEQKFISGVDPTVAYMDILSNIVRFGTSPSVSYGLDAGFATKLKKWVKNPETLVADIVAGVNDAVAATVKVVTAALGEVTKAFADADEAKKNGTESPGERELAAAAKAKGLELLGKLAAKVKDSIQQTVKKYEEEVKGIANALALLPSTPWHITIGNPLRPIFSSGDMYTTDVSLSLGSTLAFNDLPSSIKVEFTLTPARNWGLQDIMSKFNSGHLRSVNVIADSASLNPNQSLSEGGYYFPGTTTSTTGAATGANAAGGAGGGAGAATGANATGGNPAAGGGGAGSGNNDQSGGSASTTKENEVAPAVNSDPNSTKPVVVDEALKQKRTKEEQLLQFEKDDEDSSKKRKETEQANSQQDSTADANATGKRGYTYEIVKRGTLKSVIVKDKDGNKVLQTPDSGGSTDEAVIKEAKIAANDV